MMVTINDDAAEGGQYNYMGLWGWRQGKEQDRT